MPSTAQPRVSIGVPVYNGEAFLRETLESLLGQTYGDLELLISDNGSTDGTAAICESFVKKDSRVRYYRSDVNRGAAWNHNVLVERASGELFKWNSADDVCAPDYLEKCIAALDRMPDAALACAHVLEIDESGRPLAVRIVPPEVSSQDPRIRFERHAELDHLCIHIYGVIRATLLKRTDLIGSYTDSDRVLLAHLALLGPFAVVPEQLFFNRHHSRRSTQAYVGWRSRSAWFDPAAAQKRLYPFWTEFFAFWNVIGRSSLGHRERLRCYRVMLKWMWTYRVFLLYEDLLYYPRQWIVRNVPGAGRAWAWVKGAAPRLRTWAAR